MVDGGLRLGDTEASMMLLQPVKRGDHSIAGA